MARAVSLSIKAVVLSLVVGKASSGCVLHGTESGVCDYKFNPGYHDMPNGWTPLDTLKYRHAMMPFCAEHVRYEACVPEMELVNTTVEDYDVRYLPKHRIAPSREFPEGRFMNHTIKNKDLWVKHSMENIIDYRLNIERKNSLARKERNEFGEGNCGDNEQNEGRCDDWPTCEKGGCVGYPIEHRMHNNQDCREAFRRYFCYINFPRCQVDERTGEHKSVAICRSACKNFFRACNYDKSLHRCGNTEFMNAQEPEVLEDYGRYMRDFFPGQPFRNSYKDKGFTNIDGRCTPGLPDGASHQTASTILLLFLFPALMAYML